MEEKVNHSGHRQRIKNRVKKYGLKSLEQHEMLEVLLTYCIPRKDTNSLAHKLIEQFGSVANVMDAKPSQLKLIKGLGDETILFLNILHDVVDVYLEKKNDTKLVKLDTTAKCVEYFKQHFQIKEVESFCVFCLTKTGILSHYFILDGETDTEIEFAVQALIENISSDKIKQAVLIHTHPSGNVSPSASDFNTTERIFDVCLLMGVELADHIIINKENYFSFKNYGVFNKIKAEKSKRNKK